MKAMLKYSLDFGENILSIPGGLTRENGGAQIAHQPGQMKPLQLWTLVDDSQPVVTEHIYVAVTGEALTEGHAYYNLGTVLLNGGGFVVHALYVREE